MTFTRSRTRSTARRSQTARPAEVDTLEAKLLLATTPNLLTPTGTFTDPTPEITWEAVDGAVSYDLWVTSLESYETVHTAEGVTGTSYTPPTELSLGAIRMWARANFADDTTSAWSPSHDVLLASKPVVTGPTGSGKVALVSDTTPDITWSSGTGASRFQIWLTDVTTSTATQYFVDNPTPLLDDAGDPVLDSSGDPVLVEARSFTIPDDAALQLGRYRVWVQSTDPSGRISDWSEMYEFNIGPKPTNLSPSAPTFQEMPLLTWDAVDRASEYEVFVSPHPFDDPVGSGGSYVPIYRETVTTNSFQIPDKLATGGYVFWVRAVARPTDAPAVYGSWSNPSKFNTLRAPVITAPVETDGVVTEARPIVEWTVIDGAARYEVLVQKFDSRPPFVEVQVNDTKYQFSEVIPAGEYTVWVRPIDTRGNFGPWSAAWHFTASGGRPVITSPTPGEVTLLPTFEWLPVTDADVSGYELWVSHVGVDFTFINVELSGTSFDATAPLDDGDYRVWVRALFTDGTMGPWSTPVDFEGGVAATDEPADELQPVVASVQTELTSDPEAWRPADAPPADQIEAPYVPVAEPPAVERTETHEVSVTPATELPQDVVTRLAQECVDSAWWHSADEQA